LDDGAFIIIAILAAATVSAVLIFKRAELSSKIEPKPAGASETGIPAEGDKAVVSKTLRPIGVIDVAGRPFEATSEGEFIEPGTEVTVIGRLGGRALVRKAKGQ